MLYFADSRWWKWHRNRPEFQAFRGEKITIENNGDDMTAAEREEYNTELAAGRIGLLHNYGGESQLLSTRPNGLATGQNGAYQALNLAVLAGAPRILLLGVDLKAGPAGPHWFGEHPVRTDTGLWSAFLANFRRVAPVLRERGIEVLNCSPDSALDCFRRVPLEEALT